MDAIELRTEYLRFIKHMKMQAEDALVGAGGALVMLGLIYENCGFRKETTDIDVSVPLYWFNVIAEMEGIKEHTYPAIGNRPARRVLTHPDFPLVDIHERENDEEGGILLGVYVTRLAITLSLRKA